MLDFLRWFSKKPDPVDTLRGEMEAEIALKRSTEPWVELKSIGYDPNKGIELALDWNEAFVQHLKTNGFTGVDDETVVQRWVAIMTKELSDRMETQSIDQRDGDIPQEFV